MSTAHSQKHGLWKAAVLVDSLDRAAADLVLDQMDPRHAQAIRQAMVDLEMVDPQAREEVLEEFFRAGSRSLQSNSPGVELDRGLARRLAQREDATRPAPAGEAPASAAAPFGFLHNAEDERVARALGDERPQTIALVLSHLPHEQAGKVLVHLAPHVQTEVLRRLAHLEEIDPEVLREVEHVVQARFSRVISLAANRMAGYTAVANIVKAAGGRVPEATTDPRQVHEPLVSNARVPRQVRFEDLGRLEPAALAEVVSQTDPEILVLALVGSERELVDRMVAPLAEPEGICIRHRLENLGPTRLSDVEEARRQMAELAGHLAAIGVIHMQPQDSRRRVPLAA